MRRLHQGGWDSPGGPCIGTALADALDGAARGSGFGLSPDVWVDRRSTAWLGLGAGGLRHVTEPLPAEPAEGTPKQLALLYLDAVAPGSFGVTRAQLRLLSRRARIGALAPPGPGHWLRWRAPRRLVLAGGGEGVSVVAQQTVLVAGLPEADVPGGGLRVLLRRAPGTGAARYQVVASTASLLPSDTPPPAPAPEPFAALKAFAEGRPELPALLAMLLGRPLIGSITPGRLVRLPPNGSAREPATIGVEVEFLLHPSSEGAGREVPHRAVLDFLGEGGAPRLRSLEALAANCAPPTGLVFPLDPESRLGAPRLTPGRAAAELDRARVSVTLEELHPPSAAGRQALRGRLVEIMGTGAVPNPLGIEPPSQPEPLDFTSRSDAFAAVNAYHHCTCALRLAEAFGCTEGRYFDTAQFPLRVAHRGPIVLLRPPTDRVPYVDAQVFTVNAQVLREPAVGGDQPGRLREVRFALGDLSDAKTQRVFGTPAAARPALGSATDLRWVWHEMAHVLLAAATGALQLPFAHSVGDALAAILCDPQSEYARPCWNAGDRAMRGVTFPWIDAPLRRHDRAPEKGWAWHGFLNAEPYSPASDPNGYRAEQILSTTLFRLYLAVGGDARLISDGEPDRARQRRAANYVAYLIMRALQGLWPIEHPPIPLPSGSPLSLATPEALVTAMMMVDATTREFTYAGDTRLGGALLKPIHWAFEQQGLFLQPGAALPRNGPGDPPPVDVWIEDEAGRGGHYRHTETWHAHPAALRVQAPGSGEGPVPGRPNLLHLRIGNRGTEAAMGLSVRAWATTPDADPQVWDPRAWQPLAPGPAAPPPAIPPGGAVEWAAFAWTPHPAGAQAVLVEVAAPGDRSLLHEPSGLRCADGPTPVADLVPFDNNLGYRSWTLP